MAAAICGTVLGCSVPSKSFPRAGFFQRRSTASNVHRRRGQAVTSTIAAASNGCGWLCHRTAPHNRAVDSLRTGSAAIFRAETGAARPAGRCRLPPSVTERQHPPTKLLDSPGERPRVVDFEGPLTYRQFTEFLRVNLTGGCHETTAYFQRGPAFR